MPSAASPLAAPPRPARVKGKSIPASGLADYPFLRRRSRGEQEELIQRMTDDELLGILGSVPADLPLAEVVRLEMRIRLADRQAKAGGRPRSDTVAGCMPLNFRIVFT